MRPPRHVVAAFGGDPDHVEPLTGGQGTSWRSGPIVLKPVEPGEPVGWLAELCQKLGDRPEFRLGRWVRSVGGCWRVDGWAATQWVAGEHRPGHWKERLTTAAAFHAALATHTSDLTDALRELAVWDDPWSIGMRVAWGQREPMSGLPRAIDAALDRLSPALAERWTGPPPQLIHGDLAGNMLYADGLPQAIIDMSPHLAPAPFAQASIVADTVAWDGAPESFAAWYAATHAWAGQLLARAVVFRLIAVAILAPDDPDRAAAEVRAYEPVMAHCGAS